MSFELQIERSGSYAGLLARTLLEQGRYAEAANAFRLATGDDPYCVEWWLGLARCMVRQGDRRSAMEALVAATEVDPELAEAHNELGTLEKHPRLAEESFRAAVAADPHNPMYRGNLAVSLFRQWRFDEAEANWRRAIRQAPGDLSYAVDLGHMLMELGRYSGAKAVFRRAVRAIKHDAILVGRAWLHYEAQRFDEAEQALSGRQRGPCDEDLAWAYQGFGLALRKLGDNRPAIIAFRAAISLLPELAVFHRNLGDTLSTVNRSRQARAAFERARQLGNRFITCNRDGWLIALRQPDIA
ncbi:MAG: tetratricopeptide repeat protein [Myxococcota bacterium]